MKELKVRADSETRRRRLEMLARIGAGKPKANLYWSSNGSYTDGSDVWIDPDAGKYSDLDTLICQKSTTTHEANHLKFTDFRANAGDPFVNIFEDARIDQLGYEDMPGQKMIRRLAFDIRHKEMLKKFKADEKDVPEQAFVGMGWKVITGYDLPDLDDEAQSFIDEVMADHAKRAVMSSNTIKLETIAQEVKALFKERFGLDKDDDELMRQDLVEILVEFGPSGNSNLDEAEGGKGMDLAPTELPDHMKDDAPEGGDGGKGSDSEDGENGESDGEGSADGDSDGEDGDESDSGSSDGEDGDTKDGDDSDSDSGDGYTGLTEDMKKEAKQRMKKSLEKELTDEKTRTQMEAKRREQSIEQEKKQVKHGLRGGGRATYARIRWRFEEQGSLQAYNATKQKNSALINTVTRKLKAIFEAKRKTRWGGRTSYGRVNISRLALAEENADDRIFQRKVKEDRMDIAISLLIDWSGSMRGQGKQDAARDAAVVLSEVCSGLGVAFEVAAFTDEMENLAFYVLKSFNEPWDAKTKARVGLPQARGGTPQTAATEVALIRLKARPEAQRILIEICDGEPHFEADLKQIAKLEPQRDVKIIGIGIAGFDCSAYFKNAIKIVHLDELRISLVNIVKLAMRRK